MNRARGTDYPEWQTPDFLDSVIENMPSMVFIKEAKELPFLRVNRACEEAVGVSREELVSRNAHDISQGQLLSFYAPGRTAACGKDHRQPLLKMGEYAAEYILMASNCHKRNEITPTGSAIRCLQNSSFGNPLQIDRKQIS